MICIAGVVRYILHKYPACKGMSHATGRECRHHLRSGAHGGGRFRHVRRSTEPHRPGGPGRDHQLEHQFPAPPGDVVARARILKLGKRLAVGEVLLHGGDEEDLIAHVTSTYSILPQDSDPAI